MSQIEKASIHCVDPRVTQFSDDYGGLKIRLVGAGLGGVKDSMAKYLDYRKRRKLGIFTHTRCGAHNLIRKSLGEKRPEQADQRRVYDALVEPFRKIGSTAEQLQKPGALEVASRSIQSTIANGWIESGKSRFLKEVSCEEVEVTGTVPEEGRVLLITNPTTNKWGDILKFVHSELDWVDPQKTFILTPIQGKVKEIVIDVKVALMYLGIENVVLLNGDDNISNGPMHKVLEAYGKRKFRFPNTNVEILRT